MPYFCEGEIELYYETHGDGYPLLLIAPGGMRSAIPLWDNAPWNPVDQLRKSYRVIVMDQRNAGRSRGPVSATDGWHTYARDQLALLDHLGIDRFHVGGMCIGGSYSMGLIKAAPTRVTAAVLFQTIGLHENRQAFYEMYDGWARPLQAAREDLEPAALQAFKHRLYDADFLFAVDREFVARCGTPLLVLAGDDLYHPKPISLELARLAPHAVLVEHWKEPASQAAAQAAIERFLSAHTPG